MAKRGVYTVRYSHPALGPGNGSSRKEIIKAARLSVKRYGGHARITYYTDPKDEGKDIYECWQSKVSGGVRGQYLAKRKANSDYCPECHAPLKLNAKKLPFHVAPHVPLGRACPRCGQMAIQL